MENPSANDEVTVADHEPLISRKSDTKAAEPYSSYSNGRKRMFVFLVAGAGFLGPFAGNIYVTFQIYISTCIHLNSLSSLPWKTSELT